MAAGTPLAGLTPPACTTKRGEVGVCCAALTQFGAAAMATGFQYTSTCDGKKRCMKCGIRPSISKNPKKTGTPVFVPRRMSCGPSGCPQLAGQAPIPPAGG